MTLPEGTSGRLARRARPTCAQVDAQLRARAARARGSRRTPRPATATFVSKDGRTAFAVAYPPPDPDPPFGDNPKAEKAAQRRAARARRSAGAPVHLTGFDALAEDSGERLGRPRACCSRRCSAALGALPCSRSCSPRFLAFVPIVMAIASIMTTFLLLLGLTQLTDVSPIVQFLIALIGLGVAIDYSLIVVSRWREERAHGRRATRRSSGRWRPPAAPSCSAA